MTYNMPLPNTQDELNAPFWAAAKESRLRIQQCQSCSYLRWPAAPLCPECWARETEWVDVSQQGTLWSYAVYKRSMHPAFKDAVPYTVAAVQITDGPIIMGTVMTDKGAFGAEQLLRIGDKMQAVFEAVTPDVTLLRWHPVPNSG